MSIYFVQLRIAYITTSKSGNTVTIDYGPLITTMTNFAEAVVQTPSKYSINQFNSDTRYYRLGVLTLPQNGYQARITLIACQGYGLSNSYKSSTYPNPQNYSCEIYVYSGKCYKSIHESWE
jgi:hypothetical protein